MIGRTLNRSRITARSGAMNALMAALFLAGGASLRPAVAGDGLPPVGLIEFFGVRKVSPEKLRKALGIAEGDTAPDSAAAVETARRRLERAGRVTRATIEAVCCHEGRTILFVGIAERGAPRLAYRPAPAGTIRLPETITAAYDRLMDAWMAAVLRGGLEEDTSQGHSLANDPPIRAIQEEFLAFAGPNVALIREVLREAADGDQRAAAAWVIGYAPDKAAIVPDLVDAARDPDGRVRNNAVRALGVIVAYARLHPGLGIRVQPDLFVDMLESLSWTDRNKALFVLMEITSGGDAGALDALRRRSIPSLAEMARWRSPGHALPAFTLLARLAGVAEAEIVPAWNNGRRGEVIARALATATGEP